MFRAIVVDADEGARTSPGGMPICIAGFRFANIQDCLNARWDSLVAVASRAGEVLEGCHRRPAQIGRFWFSEAFKRQVWRRSAVRLRVDSGTRANRSDRISRGCRLCNNAGRFFSGATVVKF